MLFTTLLSSSLFFLTVTATATPTSLLYSPLISQKVVKIAKAESNPATYPQYTDRTTGTWKFFSPNTWTSGFFPVTMYAMNTRAGLCKTSDGSSWLSYGRKWSAGLVPLEKTNTLEHDVGFVSMPFVEELRVNPSNTTARTAVINFANDLAARYSPIVGCTRSWDTSDPTLFEVIIDNMMNLEVLWQAAALNGNQTLTQIAISHANKTMQNHIRADGSSFHLVTYNATTGAVISQGTAQGYSNNSTWSRGEAWGIYGFANMYNHTRMFPYLATARAMGEYFYYNLPSGGVVPWDFNAPVANRPADSSAAMIAATGMLLLANMENTLSPPNATGYNHWTNLAIHIVNNMTHLAWKPTWQSLLANGTVNQDATPKNNLTGIVYGDYYFIKAGNDMINMGLAKCP